MRSYPHVVFIHGAGGGGWEWRTWQAEFEARGWPTMAPDLQPAPGGLAATTIEDYVEQVVALLEPRAAGASVLVGASMGGVLALKAAERVRPAALVLVNSVPPAGTPGWPRQPAEFPAVMPWSTTSTLEGTRASMPEADEETVLWAHARWRDESGAVLQALHGGIRASPPSVPSLVLIGAADQDVPPGVGTALAERLDADAMRFAGVSHVGALLGQRAPLIARLAREWLEEIVLGGKRSVA